MMDAEDAEDQMIRNMIEKIFIGHGILSMDEILSVDEARLAFHSAIARANPPTSLHHIPLSALRHQQQRIGLFLPR